jgi:hypothetical protein
MERKPVMKGLKILPKKLDLFVFGVLMIIRFKDER